METAPTTTADVCPECGLHLVQPINTGGLCPRCLIATAIENLSTVDHPGLGRFGGIGITPDVEQLNALLPAYEFYELLGRGGAGWVFRARQKSLDREVAVKVLHGNATGISDASQRFAREAQILARLNHRRIVTVHDSGTLPDSQYLVMEYVAGPTLRDVLRRPAVRDAALRITDQICEAVEYAHSMGVLHRDLKPENVIFETVDQLDTLKVADFGISRLIGDTEPGFHQTQTGFVVGTPFYAAPEQMAGDRPIDGRADIYSIGVMLYEMLTGQVPRGKFPPPSHLTKAPAGIDWIVLRCLESNPAKRYPDVPTLRKRLQEVTSGVTRRRRMLRFALAAAALAVPIVWAAIAWSGRDGQRIVQQPPAPNKTSDTPPASVPQKAPTVDVPPPVAPPGATPPTESPKPNEVATSTDAAENTDKPKAPSTAVTSAPPPREEDYFRVFNVKVSGFTPNILDVHLEGQREYDQFALKPGASLVWVIQTSGVHRIDKPFEIPAGKREFKISEHVNLDPGDRWPIEIYIAERWYEPTTGSRRLSNSVRVTPEDIQSGPFPTPPPFGRRPFPSGPPRP